MTKVAVTGGSGGAGGFVVRDLLDHGYDVINLDLRKPGAPGVPPANDCPFVEIDLTRYGDVFAALAGVDTVIHLAANPQPDFDFLTGADRFANNTGSTFNVMWAAAAHGIKRVVWASSETVLGFPFERVAPKRVPVTEDDAPLPQNAYALSKLACEGLADQLSILHGMSFVGLRSSNILYEDPAHDSSYAKIPGYWPEPASRKSNLWGYVDARDFAQSARLGLEASIRGSENFIIAAADTIMRQSNRELIEAMFPGTQIAPDLGDHQTMISIDKARRLLGYEPEYSWRTVLDDGLI